MVALRCCWRGGFARGGWVSEGAVREGAGGVGILRAKAWLVLPAGGVGVCGRRLTSLEASLWSPASSYALGSCSSGESLRPGWVGRRRRHRRFPLWGVVLKSFGSRSHASWAGRSRHYGRQVPVWQCGCCAASCLWQRWRLRAESGLLMVLGSRSLPACSRSRRSGAGSAQAQHFSPAMLVDRVGAAWSPARVVDYLTSAGASLDASPRRRVCVLVWVVRSPCVPCFCRPVVTIFARFSVY